MYPLKLSLYKQVYQRTGFHENGIRRLPLTTHPHRTPALPPSSPARCRQMRASFLHRITVLIPPRRRHQRVISIAYRLPTRHPPTSPHHPPPPYSRSSSVLSRQMPTDEGIVSASHHGAHTPTQAPPTCHINRILASHPASADFPSPPTPTQLVDITSLP